MSLSLGLLQPLYAVILMVAVGAWLFAQRAKRKPREDDGTYWLTDHADGAAGLAMEVAKVAPTLGVGLIACSIAYTMYTTGSGLVAGIPLVFALMAFSYLYWPLQRMRVLLAMAPGELGLPEWPLTPDRTITVTYRRRLRREASLNILTCRFLRYRRELGGKRDHTKTRLVEHAAFEVPSAGGRVRDGWLEATFEVTVPRPFDKAGVSFFPYDRQASSPEFHWHLQLTAVFDGKLEEDSVFQLTIADELTKVVPQATRTGMEL